MTGCLQCAYNVSADIGRVQSTIRRYWPSNPDTAEMFQTAIGYSMTGEVSAKRIFMLIGNQNDAFANGDNGKSLIQNALLQLFGSNTGGLGTSIKPTVILDTGKRDANGHDGAKTPLIGKRLAISTEPPRDAKFEPGEFNRICGGDIQSARLPYAKHSVNFVNIASIWVSMNTIPEFSTWDRATRTRLTPFPFNETFYAPGKAPDGCQERENGLDKCFQSEEGKQALGLYAVRGAIKFYAFNNGTAGNFPESKAVAEFRDEILKASIPFEYMFETLLEFRDDSDITKKVMLDLLTVYLGDNPKRNQQATFKGALQGMGVRIIKVKGERKWRGVGLTDKGRELAIKHGIIEC